MSVASRWFVGGLLAVGVGLAVWETTFILVPAELVAMAIGATKWVRRRPHSASR